MLALTDIPDTGDYFSIAKIVVFALLVMPWLYVAPKVSHDARKAHALPETWSMAVLVAGLAGAILWLVLPIFVAGLAAYLLFAGGSLAAYVVYRNGRVPAAQRIFTKDHLARLTARKATAIEVVAKIKLYDSHGKIVYAPDGEEPSQVLSYNLLQDVLYDIVWHRASEVTLAPAEQEMTFRFVVDGVPASRDSLDLAEGQAMIQFLKPLAGLDPAEVRRPQKGDFSLDFGSKRIDLSVNTAGSTGGQQIQFRIAQEVVRQQLDALGMSEDVLKAVRQMNKKPGLIIVSGRPASGVTSTMYSLLREQDAFMKQLVTFETRPAVQLENITQIPYSGSGLADVLGPAIRRDPDAILVDQCSDAASAKLILEAAATKTVLLGMNAEDSLVALAKWVKLCGNTADAVAHLHGVLCQMLLRKLCPTCRESYQPDPQLLAKANLPADQIDKFYRPPSEPAVDDKGKPAPCSTCQDIGYFQRTGAFELLALTDDIRQLIASGAGLRDIKSACRKNKMLYLQEQALRQVIAGVTSIQEVLRASAQPKPS